MLAGVGLVQFVIGNILLPRLAGGSLNISLFVTILSLFAFGALWGVTGMFVAMPLTAMLVIVFAHFEATRPIAILLSRTGELDVPERRAALDGGGEKPFSHERGNASPRSRMARAGRRVTIHDVASAAGVSIATASKALNDTGRVGPETRARVKRVAAEIGFRPNALARGLLCKRSFTIGLLTNDTYGRFTLPVMAGISQALADHRISVFLCAIEDDPALGQIHVEAMLDKQVDGIIATGKRIDRRLPVDLVHLPVPVVYAFSEGTARRGDPAPRRRAGRDAGGRAPHRASAAGASPTSPARRASSRCASAPAPTARSPATRSRSPIGPWSEAWGHEAVARLWAGAEPPDALFCGNDQIARGVVDALRERGVGVPEDVSVVGFDNWEIVAAQTRPPLTTVDMNLKELGRQAGLIVRALAEGERVEPGVRRLPCRLVVRKSCGGAAPVGRKSARAGKGRRHHDDETAFGHGPCGRLSGADAGGGRGHRDVGAHRHRRARSPSSSRATTPARRFGPLWGRDRLGSKEKCSWICT